MMEERRRHAAVDSNSNTYVEEIKTDPTPAAGL
jgi:hypothetical protein